MTTATETLNKVAVIGHVAFDPFKFKKGGVANLNVINENSEYTTRIAVKTFSADYFDKNLGTLNKGDLVKVTGSLQSALKNRDGDFYDHPDNWINPRTIEVLEAASVVDDIAPDDDGPAPADDDDDIPF